MLLFTLSTVLKEVTRYVANEDKPVISFKKFNMPPLVGKNPTYTICFEELSGAKDKAAVFKQDYLFNKFGLDKNDYKLLLRGGVTGTLCMESF